MTEANLIEYENKKLKYARKWCYVQTSILLLQAVQTAIRKDVVFSIWLQIFDGLQVLNIMWCLLLSEKKNIKTIYVVLLLI